MNIIIVIIIIIIVNIFIIMIIIIIIILERPARRARADRRAQDGELVVRLVQGVCVCNEINNRLIIKYAFNKCWRPKTCK